MRWGIVEKVRLVLAGIPLAIARRVLCPVHWRCWRRWPSRRPRSRTDVLGALPPQAAQQLDAAVATLPAPPQAVQRAVEAVPPAADVVRKAPQSAAAPVEQTVSGSPPPAGPGRVDNPVAAVNDAAATVQGAATDVRRRAPALSASPVALPALDETLRGLGDTLRGRLDSLVGAVAPLLADIGLGKLTHVSPARPATPGSPAAAHARQPCPVRRHRRSGRHPRRGGSTPLLGLAHLLQGCLGSASRGRGRWPPRIADSKEGSRPGGRGGRPSSGRLPLRSSPRAAGACRTGRAEALAQARCRAGTPAAGALRLRARAPWLVPHGDPRSVRLEQEKGTR